MSEQLRERDEAPRCESRNDQGAQCGYQAGHGGDHTSLVPNVYMLAASAACPICGKDTPHTHPEAAPPRATTPEPVPCKTPDCTLIFAHDGACIPAGSYSTYSAPTRESGALLDELVRASEFYAVISHEHSHDFATRAQYDEALDEQEAARAALDARLSTLERDAARMREALTFYADRELYKLNIRDMPKGRKQVESSIIEQDRGTCARAALSPSGDTERSA